MTHKIDRIVLLGCYIPGQKWKRPNRGCVYAVNGISPCMCDFSGGGNIIPAILKEYDFKNNDIRPALEK